MDTRTIPTEPIEETVAWLKRLLSEEASNVIPFPVLRGRIRREK